MKKINLLLSHSNFNSFSSHTIQEIFKDYFNFIYIEDNPIISKEDTLLVSNLTENRWYANLQSQGYRVVIDLLWSVGHIEIENALLLYTPNWFWYHDCQYYIHTGYNNYVPNKTYKKLALMPMGNLRDTRTQLYNKVTDLLDDFVWSYEGLNGTRLPDDVDHSEGRRDPFYFNPAWYNDTYFSLVSETAVDPIVPYVTPEGIYADIPGQLLSEKTFKPLAYGHPMVVWGQPGLLAALHKLGFETFENLFDESYDSIIYNESRLNKVVANVRAFERRPYDTLTLEKLQHNQNLFFNFDLVKQRMKNEIVDPIYEFFESR